MNCEALGLPDATFDRALCAFGLMYVPDPLVALKELHRGLKPGGRVAVAVRGARRNCGWADLFPIVDARAHSEVCPMFFGLGATGALRNDMEQAGFHDIATERLSVPLRFDSRAQQLSAMIDGGPVAMAAKRFDAETREAVEAELLASVAPWRAGEGYEIPGEFVIASGGA